MAKDYQLLIKTCIFKMLSPVAGFCVQRGIRFQDFVEFSKNRFVRSAQDKLREEGREASVSAISVMTGLQRPEVKRILQRGMEKGSKDIIAKILGQWSNDRRFLDSRGKPLPLSTRGVNSPFAKLVAAVSKDMRPHSVLFELERLGLVLHENLEAILIKKAFIISGDPEKVLEFASEDAMDLLRACERNAFSEDAVPNLHARTVYDNIPDQHLPEIRDWFLKCGRKVHEEARKFLSKLDRDINPKIKAGADHNRVVLGTFSLTERVKKEDQK